MRGGGYMAGNWRNDLRDCISAIPAAYADEAHDVSAFHP
jgi:hypothetical protein